MARNWRITYELCNLIKMCIGEGRNGNERSALTSERRRASDRQERGELRRPCSSSGTQTYNKLI